MYEDLKIKIKEISKSRKIKVFYFGNTAGIEKNSFYLTALRKNYKFEYFGAIIFSENSAKKISKIVDGKFDFILLDVEKKVISKKINQYVNIERAVKETIKKTKIYNYKGNDLTINACETLVNHIYSQDPRGVGGKKILVLGVGNIGFKISLKLLEAGADVYLYRRNKNILSNISKTINFIKPKATVAKAKIIKNLNINLKNFDLIIGATMQKSLIFSEHVKKLNSKVKIIDIGKGIIDKNALHLLLKKSIQVYRLDATPGYDGHLENIYSTLKINDTKLKKLRKLKNFKLVKRGILSKENSIIVDDVNNPKIVYGVSDGRGGFKKVSSKKISQIKKNLKK